MNGPPPGRDTGFVLLETLVAFLVLAVALTAAIAAISQGGLSLRRADAVDLAADVARELAVVRLDPMAATGSQAGELRGAAWRIEARPLATDGLRPLYAVTIIVHAPGAARPFVFRSFAAGLAQEVAP